MCLVFWRSRYFAEENLGFLIDFSFGNKEAVALTRSSGYSYPPPRGFDHSHYFIDYCLGPLSTIEVLFLFTKLPTKEDEDICISSAIEVG